MPIPRTVNEFLKNRIQNLLRQYKPKTEYCTPTERRRNNFLYRRRAKNVIQDINCEVLVYWDIPYEICKDVFESKRKMEFLVWIDEDKH
jgi:hypothetical protein